MTTTREYVQSIVQQGMRLQGLLATTPPEDFDPEELRSIVAQVDDQLDDALELFR